MYVGVELVNEGIVVGIVDIGGYDVLLSQYCGNGGYVEWQVDGVGKEVYGVGGDDVEWVVVFLGNGGCGRYRVVVVGDN